MKTLDRKKSEELFYEFKNLSRKVDFLASVVQNPDFVTEENAQENYEMFYLNYKSVLDRLDALREEVFKIHDDVLSK